MAITTNLPAGRQHAPSTTALQGGDYTSAYSVWLGEALTHGPM